MRNLTDEIKNNFLILGVTGPLRSGCTTVAKFFADGKHRNYNKILTKEFEKDIQYYYHQIGQSRKGKAVCEELNKTLRLLKESTRIRDIYYVLERSEQHDFCYISMSAILLKYSYQYWKKASPNIISKYDVLIDLFKKVDVDDDLINKIEKSVRKEIPISDISDAEYLAYDKYLNQINEIMSDLKSRTDFVQRVNLLQDMGDNTRCCGNPFEDAGVFDSSNVTILAQEAKCLIKYYKNRADGKSLAHFVVDAFRNPHEVEYFRYRYYEFYLLSVTSNLNIRNTRRNYNKDIDDRDSGNYTFATEYHKQNVSKCVYLSDLQIDNSVNDDDYMSLYRKLLLYAALIQSPGCIAPTTHELFMSQAYGLSLKSACISRQVGAVIVGENGYVVGAGWNDVGAGQVGCGMRRIDDVKRTDNDDLPLNPQSEAEFRKRFNKRDSYERFCFKDEYSKYEIEKIILRFSDKARVELDGIGITKEMLDKLIQLQMKYIKMKRLEYCRALHAEENALLQSAKIGGIGVRGGKIYTTYFPCELCSKKIYQSGINEIIYTEPYPDSVAQDVILKDGIRNIRLTPFEGVKSHSFFRLYKSVLDKKEAQEIEKA